MSLHYRPAISNQGLAINGEGNVVLKLKTPRRNCAPHIVMTQMESSGWRR